jgi:hypothetical protein
VRFDFSAQREGAAAPDRLVVTINSRDEPDPPQTLTFAVDSALRGELATRRTLDPDKHYDVRLSTVSGDGRASAATLVELGRQPRRTVGALLRRVLAAVDRLTSPSRRRGRAGTR